MSVDTMGAHRIDSGGAHCDALAINLIGVVRIFVRLQARGGDRRDVRLVGEQAGGDSKPRTRLSGRSSPETVGNLISPHLPVERRDPNLEDFRRSRTVAIRVLEGLDDGLLFAGCKRAVPGLPRR